MIRILCLFVLLSGAFSSVRAASAAEDQSPQELTRRYLSVLGRAEGMPKIETHEEGFECIVKLTTHLMGNPHTHVSDGPQYGFSFVGKNLAPLEFVKDLVTGEKKNWPKDKILTTPISIADVGCGLGFSAACLVSKAVNFYKSQPGWTFKSPIRIDLYDISPEHQNALQPLAALINGAYSEYFHVETFVQDAGDAFPQKKYNVVFALNLLHYVPESKWSSAIKNIEGILQQGSGMLFVTTDHYHGFTWNVTQFQRLEAAAKKRKEDPALSPFVSALVCLANPVFGEQFQTRALNSSFDPFLTDPAKYVPGTPARIEDIDMAVVEKVLRRHSSEHGKLEATVGVYDGQRLVETPVEEVIARLKDGRLFIQLANYGFDESLLEKAVLDSSEGKLERLKTSWHKGLLPNEYGYPTTVGLTFIKK